MIALTAGKTIEILLGGAVTAHQVEVVSSWTDVDPAASPQVVSPAGNDLVTADGTPVTAVAAPAGTVARGVDHLSAYNADTVAATVIVQVNNGSAVRRLTKAELQPGESLTYSGRMGWLTLDDQGAIKSTGQAVLLAGSPVVGGAANAVLHEDAGQVLAASAALTFLAGTLTITAGASTALTQTGSQTVLDDPTGVQVQIAGAPMLTITATAMSGPGSYLVATATALEIGFLTYTWPSVHAAGVLTNDGAGLLTWANPSSLADGGGTVVVSVAGAVTLTPTAGQALTLAGTLAHTGTEFGAFGAAPVTRPTSAGLSGGFTGVGNAITADSTFQGGVGTSNYSIDDLVAAFKGLGFLTP